ncbi:MAG: rhomboid family intramembrane serine protease [Deltaproteobacteria bacterium]|nr:rhomboid family intramembrane serine protease [Deltaproteobacteria bacterium]
MLIIPLTGKISIRNPPLITIAIILVNCFVYFGLQSDDGEVYSRAIHFYFESGLGKIETSKYQAYLKTASGEKDAALTQGELNKDAMMRLWARMQQDDVFMNRLIKDEIIAPTDQQYAEWKNLRREYEGIISKMVIQKYGHRPMENNLITPFTHMFLHGGFAHLLGNMIFLWLVGCVLELGCGRLFYTSLYLLTGFLSALLFGLVYANSQMPLVGASGAISGLMGAYTVLYGKKKIRVFYSIVIFYFNYTKVPAILLLPIWIGQEFYQLLFGSVSQVAYVAHIGGLISGAVLGYVDLRFLGLVSNEVFTEDPKEKIAPLLEEAMESLSRLDMQSARPLLEEVLKIDPNNLSALTHLFNIDKLNPENEIFHITASRLFLRLIKDDQAYEKLHMVYKEYQAISKRLRLSPDLLLQLASTFSAHGYIEESERIIALLLKSRPEFQKLPTSILKLAQAYLKKGMKDKGKNCLAIIVRKYPQSPESLIARRLLKTLG